MRYALVVIAVAALCAPAFGQGGGNPGCKMFVTFDSGTTDNATVVGRADPAQYTEFYAYFGVTDLVDTYYEIPDTDTTIIGGLTTVSFMASVTPGISSPPAFTNLLPGDLAIGSWDTGVTLASTECMPPPVVLVGYLTLFYIGSVDPPTTGDITILEHPEYPGWVVDCSTPSARKNIACIWQHGGVNKDPEAGDGGCEANTPVQDAETWGGIKALYR